MNYEFEKKEQEAKLEQDKKDVIAQEEFKNQRNVINSFIIGFILIILLAGVILKSYRQDQKNNKLLQIKNTLIEAQSKLVEEKNKDITDSINYAKQIQDAILPSSELTDQLFPDSFIFYKPRDIVSGDFYWMAEKNNRKFIAVADCTGHGIPGAFMSMIGNTLLNSIILEKDIHDSADILIELRKNIIKLLKQNEFGGNRDGMDISLCIIENETLQFSGANNPLWILQNNQLKEFKADKQPIGIYSNENKLFNSNKIKLNTGDCIYLFTDGYADQFGGPQGKKFKYKSLQETLLSNQTKSMSDQKKILENVLADWQGNLEQVDDVLIIGIRL